MRLVTAAAYITGVAAVVLALAGLLTAVHLLRAAWRRLRDGGRRTEAAPAEPRHDPYDDTVPLPRVELTR